MPRMQVSIDAPPSIRFQRVGRKDASTFTGLCGRHDQMLFGPVEKQQLRISDSQHAFLLAYRAVLKENHASLKAGIDVQSTYLRGGNAGLWSIIAPKLFDAFSNEQSEAIRAYYESSTYNDSYERDDARLHLFAPVH